METPLEIYRLLAEETGPVVLATVLSVKGSSPGKPGFKMLVYPDSRIVGTVGGGNLELAVIDDALAALADNTAIIKEYSLTEGETGMWCGGKATVVIEPHAPPTRLWIFGYGNLGREVHALLDALPFSPIVMHDNEVDGIASRAITWNTLEPFPEVSAQDFVLVLTMDADIELAIIQRVASIAPQYIGVIGSKTKGGKLRKKLSEAGVDPDSLNLHLPVGLAIGAENAKEIAISIVAELIKEQHGA